MYSEKKNLVCSRHHTPNRVSHATSLDAIARRQCFRTGFPSVSVSNKPHLNKQFPNVSSESDLQRYKTAQHSHDRKSPSLSNPTDSLKQKVCPQFSFQDNGSVKYFQSGIHTPKMGEKVAQVGLPTFNPPTAPRHPSTTAHHALYSATYNSAKLTFTAPDLPRPVKNVPSRRTVVAGGSLGTMLVKKKVQNDVSPENINIIKKIIDDFEQNPHPSFNYPNHFPAKSGGGRRETGSGNNASSKTGVELENGSNANNKKKPKQKGCKISRSDSLIHRYKRCQVSPKSGGGGSLDGAFFRVKCRGADSMENMIRSEDELYINFMENGDDCGNADANNVNKAFGRGGGRKSFVKNGVDEVKVYMASKNHQEQVTKNVNKVCW